MMNPNITVIIPAKNEEGSIASVVEKAKNYAQDVIVMDGGSTDSTAKIAYEKGARVEFDGGKGKGLAIRKAIELAKTDILVFMDGDGSHETSDIPKLVKPIIEDKADLVIGSRLLGGSDEIHGNFSNYIRMVGAGFITLIINLRWKVSLTDCENGFRAIKRNVARSLGLRAKDFDIEQEMVMKALKKGYRVVEIPSHEYERKSGKSKLPTIKGFKFLWRLIIELF